MAILRWLWASYEVLSFWQWLTGIIPAIGTLLIMGPIFHLPLWEQALLAGVLSIVWLGILGWIARATKKPSDGATQSQSESPNAIQFHVQGDVGGDFAGRDIHKTYVGPLPQPITPSVVGEIRPPNIFLKITNTDGQSHQFKVVFHGVTGMMPRQRVKEAWLPWDCCDFQIIGPKQSSWIQFAQADGRWVVRGGFGKSIRFTPHNKGESFNSKLSEVVAFGGELQCDLELQSDAELGIQGRRTWTLKVDGDGIPISLMPS